MPARRFTHICLLGLFLVICGSCQSGAPQFTNAPDTTGHAATPLRITVEGARVQFAGPVSYTHLTLPTN